MSQEIDVKHSDSLVGAAINAAINGVIAWFTFHGAAQVPMTLDLISTQEKSVWGQGVSLALALGVIPTLVAAKVFSGHVAKTAPGASFPRQAPVVSRGHRNRREHAMSLFGWFLVLAGLWQRTLGTIYVSPMAAAVLIGLFAGVVTVLVEVRT